MAVLKISNVTSKVVLSNPAGGQVAAVDGSVGTPGSANITVSMVILDTIADQIKAYVDAGQMSYTVEEDPNTPDDIEVGALGASTYIGNSVRVGMIAAAGSTPSVIADYNLDLTAGEAFINAKHFITAALTDWDYIGNGYDGSNSTPESAAAVLSADGKTYWGVLVLRYNGGSPELKMVLGAEADDGEEVAPTTAEITNAVDEGTWLEVARVKVQRVAVDTITETWSNTRDLGVEFA